ncbi:MAG: hypothetical protein ACREC2_00825 [Bradyrhizobium sp.]|jgi:hypothetical protein
MPSFRKKRKPSGRTRVLRTTIEQAITAAVKKSDPLCENFVGVWIEPSVQSTGEDTNWRIKGIQFGNADRDKCGAALGDAVERMQKKYELERDPGDGTRKR